MLLSAFIISAIMSFFILSLSQSVVNGTGRNVCGKDLRCHPHTTRPAILSQTVCSDWHSICHWIAVLFLLKIFCNGLQDVLV